MSQLSLLAVGKLKLSATSQLVQMYVERLSHYTKFEIIEVADASGAEPNQQKQRESAHLLAKLRAGDYVVILDEKGVSLNSQNFAGKIQSWYNAGHKRIVFVMGGAYGLDDNLKSKANISLRLSDFTLPHELARVVFLEQLYRCHTLLKGEKYHH